MDGQESRPNPAIAVRTFGSFELAFDGRPVERWKAGKARHLLQFLLLRRGHTVSRDALFESLWPDAPWSKNSSSLKVAAHMLRNVLDSRPEPTAGGPTLRLLTRESGYLLEADGVSIDYETFDRLVDRAHAAELRDDRATAAELFGEAAGVYCDDFLPDVGYDWAAAQREWLRSRLLWAFTFLTDACIRRGDHLGVLAWCRRMLDVEPFHEETYRALMLTHARLGQLAQVQRWYELCVARLRDHLQLAPDLTTQRIYRRALRGGFTGRPIDPVFWQNELQPAGQPSLLRRLA